MKLSWKILVSIVFFLILFSGILNTAQDADSLQIILYYGEDYFVIRIEGANKPTLAKLADLSFEIPEENRFQSISTYDNLTSFLKGVDAQTVCIGIFDRELSDDDLPWPDDCKDIDVDSARYANSTSRFWILDDGNKRIIYNVFYESFKIVQCVDNSNKKDNCSFTINNGTKPQANFTFSPQSNGVIQFTDRSAFNAPVIYEWDFGFGEPLRYVRSEDGEYMTYDSSQRLLQSIQDFGDNDGIFTIQFPDNTTYNVQLKLTYIFDQIEDKSSELLIKPITISSIPTPTVEATKTPTVTAIVEVSDTPTIPAESPTPTSTFTQIPPTLTPTPTNTPPARGSCPALMDFSFADNNRENFDMLSPYVQIPIFTGSLQGAIQRSYIQNDYINRILELGTHSTWIHSFSLFQYQENPSEEQYFQFDWDMRMAYQVPNTELGVILASQSEPLNSYLLLSINTKDSKTSWELRECSINNLALYGNTPTDLECVSLEDTMQVMQNDIEGNIQDALLNPSNTDFLRFKIRLHNLGAGYYNLAAEVSPIQDRSGIQNTSRSEYCVENIELGQLDVAPSINNSNLGEVGIFIRSSGESNPQPLQVGIDNIFFGEIQNESVQFISPINYQNNYSDLNAELQRNIGYARLTGLDTLLDLYTADRLQNSNFCDFISASAFDLDDSNNLDALSEFPITDIYNQVSNKLWTYNCRNGVDISENARPVICVPIEDIYNRIGRVYAAEDIVCNN